MQLNSTIFREYDIRGLAEEDLGDDVVNAIGRAYATVVRRAGGTRVALGWDCRTHSPRVQSAFRSGVTAAGVDVIEIGLVPSPLLYYSLFRLPVDGGVQITASHNPGEYNGMKICVGRDSLHGDGIRDLERSIRAGDFESGAGRVETDDSIIERYVEEWKGHAEGASGIEVVFDGGNGMAGTVLPQLAHEIGVRSHDLFLEPDGRFPNHEADPTQEKNLVDLIAEVKRTGAQLGIGYDGDADRIGVVDHTGGILWGDQLLALFARDRLSRGPATILCDIKCSDVLATDIAARGGRLVMWKSGHSLIKAKMKEESAALAGEMSGHMFFAEQYLGYDDALYASLRLLSILGRTGETIPELLSGLPPRVSTPELRIECAEEDKFRIVSEVAARLEPRFDTLTIDGVRYQAEGGWGLLRASNTGPVLVARFEAETDEQLGRVRAILQDELARYDIAI